MIRNISTLMQRELSVYFFSPIAYVVMTVYLLVLGLIFGLSVFGAGNDASLRMLLGQWMVLVLVLALPVLTMRLLSEELSTGTMETLMTAPVSDTEVVLGKFLGAYAFFVVMLVATLVYAFLVAAFGPLDWGQTVATYTGLALLGSLYVSVGLFFSACTRSQIIAVICSIAVLIILTFAADALAQDMEGTPRAVLQHLSILYHYNNFTRGLVDMNNIIFFLSMTAMFLFLSVRVLEARRWR